MDLEHINFELQRQVMCSQVEIDKLVPTVLALEEELLRVQHQCRTLYRAVEEVVAYYEENDDSRDWPTFANLCYAALTEVNPSVEKP